MLYWNYNNDKLTNLIDASKYLDYEEINNHTYMKLWIEHLKIIILHINNNNCLPNELKIKTWISRQNYEYKNKIMNNLTKYIIWGDFLFRYNHLFNKA
jgi:hypothetical protein